MAQKQNELACPACKKGVLFSVAESRLAEALSVQVYKCEKCGRKRAIKTDAE